MDSKCIISCNAQPSVRSEATSAMTTRPRSCRRRPTATSRRPAAVVFVSAAALATLVVLSSCTAAAQAVGSRREPSPDRSNNGASETPKTTFRVFQTLPNEPSQMSPAELSQMHRTIRAMQAMIFSPSRSTASTVQNTQDDDVELALDIYTPTERRDYLVKRGDDCHPRSDSGSSANALKEDDTSSSLQWYDVLSRYDSLMAASSADDSKLNSHDSKASQGGSAVELERTAIELFKFCLLSNGDGHAFWGWGEQLLLPFRDVVNVHVNYGVVAVDGVVDRAEGGVASGGTAAIGGGYIHESFLSISPYTPATSELSAMIRLLLETSDDVLASSPLLLSRELHRLIAAKEDSNNSASIANGEENKSRDLGEESNNGATWTLFPNSCIPLADLTKSSAGLDKPQFASFAVDPSSALSGPDESTSDAHARRMAARCPLSDGGYCCLTFLPRKSSEERGQKMIPAMALRHPVGGWTSDKKGQAEDQRMPYKIALEQTEDASKSTTPTKPLKLGGVSETDLPYISTVRLAQDNTDTNAQPPRETAFPTHPADTPNFFDILFENGCLPYRKECHHCLKDVSNEALIVTVGEDGEDVITINQENACSKCNRECPCYCDILCKVRPQPKPVTRTYSVRPPQYRKEPSRLVPKIIHQTWFEPVTKDKYPNMSRLIESWKKSGWEYYFWDDEGAGEFLGTHFPPEVREAYESITPGAFKADLFRYCVLLIRGGVYADMDILLETNLDEAVANDIGFMTPIDEPGIEVGHRSCLWNGLIASAPSHPFLARTIEIVVNNIRNRFTSVDYDDMLCPNPILSVSHTVDTLFTTGPCIFGASINNLLGRHMQTEFGFGDVDIWESEREKSDQDASNSSSGTNTKTTVTVPVRLDDPRLLIPGRTVILEQNKNDMGAHRFTWADRHLIVASTDMPDYDDRPSSKEHYSKTHEKAGVYGMRKLYTNTKRANEEIRFVIEKA